MTIPRHKVFISYHHDEAQWYKEVLTNMTFYDEEYGGYLSIFDDYSVGDGDISDDLPDEAIRKYIRDEYIKNATVLILLCGPKTKYRKYIDWELHAAMFDTEKNPRMGILVINLPEISQSRRACSQDEKEIISRYGNWVRYSSRQEFEENYPYMPARIIDNLVSGAQISVVDWDTICNNKKGLMKLIDNAFKRKDENSYDISRPLRRKNS